ncbi:MAG: hypothetical protein KF816_16220 [Melioribacteraceae bacterium]|nr:hypothetical protein [Melioribacteraceae bacterium]
MKNFLGHSFHIPVLGVAYSVDAPIKVAKYGISSVISIIDDGLMELLRKYYLELNNQEYIQIKANEEDSRARRITAYLNMVDKIVEYSFADLKNSPFEKGTEISKYFEMLPEYSILKKKYNLMLATNNLSEKDEAQRMLRPMITPGSIDVNIMTKLDKTNYDKSNNELSVQYNDAHSALRGYANSTLDSSIIFSAGMNPRLYSYLESLEAFYPDGNSKFKKRVVIKVSDFRSALIQGKFLAKKGIWVSEFRVESGLNCGGHAFATDGYLLGPILEEFKTRKNELFESLREIYTQSLLRKEILINDLMLNIKITVQGGVGKKSEHDFLLRHYGVDSVGWGSPFLLVPEVMNIDDYTLQLICNAKEDDYYLSNVSPLGVPFNNLRGNSKDNEKQARIDEGKPGSPCPKKFLVSNRDYTDKPICTASLTYNKKVDNLKEDPDEAESYQGIYDNAIEKACLCEGLTSTALIVKKIEMVKQSLAVSVCPGPNLAYFSKVATLKEMVDHIYGRVNLITHSNRPNLFIKELSLYINYLENKIDEKVRNVTAHKDEFILTFHKNLAEGIKYYQNLIPEIIEESDKVRKSIREELDLLEQKLHSFSFVSA